MAKVRWGMSWETYEKFLRTLKELSTLDPNFDYEQYQELVEQMRLLPGFPNDCNFQEDEVVPVITTVFTQVPDIITRPN